MSSTASSVVLAAIDVYFDGIKLVDNLGLGQGIDVDVNADVPLVTACSAGSTGIDGSGDCARRPPTSARRSSRSRSAMGATTPS